MSDTTTENDDRTYINIEAFEKMAVQVAELNKELEQQRFNNKHNLSIDGAISDKITELEERLKEAVEVIGFYASKIRWNGRFSYYDKIHRDDIEQTDDEANIYHGGKRAREFLQKIGGEA